jgi:hypothetical protein
MKIKFIFLGILFSTLVLYAGASSANAATPGGFDTFVSVTGGVYYAKDSQNNILASSSTPDLVIQTALNKRGDISISTGSYVLSSTFSGFDLSGNVHLKLAKDATMIVPTGFGGHVFRFNSGSAHNIIEGGIIQEANPAKNKWIGILMQSDTSNGVYFNLLKNLAIYNPGVAIELISGSGSWIKGNTFVNLHV